MWGHSGVSFALVRFECFVWTVQMLDLVFVVLGAALFLGSLVYARACAQV
jgi:hypothetical protein